MICIVVKLFIQEQVINKRYIVYLMKNSYISSSVLENSR